MNDPGSLRRALGKWASHLVPDLDDRVYNRNRDRSVPASRAPRGGHSKRPFSMRAPHIVVVPIEGPQYPNWGPGNWNFYYETMQAATERFGQQSVSVLDVAPGEPAASWHSRLIDLVRDTQATHLITHMEHDPGGPDEWTWDILWNQLATEWDGVFLGVMFDSAFWLVTMKARRLARISPNYMGVDICAPMAGVLIPRQFEVGPVTMPVSQQSLELVNRRIEGISPAHDVSFIGALYPYRVDMIKQLRASGIDIAVNPHRDDSPTDLHTSRTNQPGWLDYMAGLASSRMTINFSRSSAGDFEQLKTRVIEATLAGTFLITDDKTSTRRYFSEGCEFDTFSSVVELPGVIEKWLAQPLILDQGRLAAQERAQEIALHDFWDRITMGLDVRRLPSLPRR